LNAQLPHFWIPWVTTSFRDGVYLHICFFFKKSHRQSLLKKKILMYLLPVIDISGFLYQ
jgi:hypothetical protein